MEPPLNPTGRAVHPLWLRATHWLNAVAVVVLVLSGWRIYNASPLFGFRFRPELTLGGWLGGALLWHFAAMWVLIGNGIAYLALNLATGRFGARFLPLRPAAVVGDLAAALHGRLVHDDPRAYNAVQKLAYLGVIALSVLIVLSGLVVWKSVQFPWLRGLMGGYDNARLVHFLAMSGLVLFLCIHLVMVALVPRTLIAMLRGR